MTFLAHRQTERLFDGPSVAVEALVYLVVGQTKQIGPFLNRVRLAAKGELFRFGRLGGDGSFWTPAMFQPVGDGVSGDAGKCGPLDQQSCDTVDGHRRIVASIPSLFDGRSPSAIVRRVALIIVDSFNRVAIGRQAHVDNERFEGITPASANTNATSTVGRKVFGLWIVAAVLHRVPREIRSSSRRIATAITARLTVAKSASWSDIEVVPAHRVPVFADRLRFHGGIVSLFLFPEVR